MTKWGLSVDRNIINVSEICPNICNIFETLKRHIALKNAIWAIKKITTIRKSRFLSLPTLSVILKVIYCFDPPPTKSHTKGSDQYYQDMGSGGSNTGSLIFLVKFVTWP